MTPFLSKVRLVLTPLSPLHLGLGEDFDPTGYLIDEDVLYAFDPSRAALTGELREELLRVVEQADGGLHRLYAFFYRHRQVFKPGAHTLTPVARGVAEKYAGSVGRVVQREESDSEVINRNSIERTMHLAGDGRPYLPGSGVKGALRTAWLENLDDGRLGKADMERIRDVLQFESELLQGDFSNSPLRLVKIADFMPQSATVDRKIVFAGNWKKTPVQVRGESVGTGRVPGVRKEVILHGQYRAFVSESALLDLYDRAGVPRLRPRFADLARYCDAYHGERLPGEMKILRQRGLVDKDWADRFEVLLAALREKRDRGEIFLVRLGRYGGGEYKTLKKRAKIKIRMKTGHKVAKTATTLWLAGEFEKQASGLLPFGWALVEVNPREDCAPLRDWCMDVRRGRPEMEELSRRFAGEKEALERERAMEEARKAAERVREEEENRARVGGQGTCGAWR
jgi:CRISPR-associated protein Csm5